MSKEYGNNTEKVEVEQNELRKRTVGEGEDNAIKAIILRGKKSLIDSLKEKSKEHKMSLNAYANFVLNSAVEKEKPLYDETINKLEKKAVESRVFFTQSEAELLKKYAELNEWSISKEVRYRTIATLAKKPKLNTQELKAIYNVRSSLNVLGANVNRLVRDSIPISDDNIKTCQELVKLIRELKNKITYLEKCNHSSFGLKEARWEDGSQG